MYSAATQVSITLLSSSSSSSSQLVVDVTKLTKSICNHCRQGSCKYMVLNCTCNKAGSVLYNSFHVFKKWTNVTVLSQCCVAWCGLCMWCEHCCYANHSLSAGKRWCIPLQHLLPEPPAFQFHGYSTKWFPPTAGRIIIGSTGNWRVSLRQMTDITVTGSSHVKEEQNRRGIKIFFGVCHLMSEVLLC